MSEPIKPTSNTLDLQPLLDKLENAARPGTIKDLLAEFQRHHAKVEAYFDDANKRWDKWDERYDRLDALEDEVAALTALVKKLSDSCSNQPDKP
jgi:hypothetical protein